MAGHLGGRTSVCWCVFRRGGGRKQLGTSRKFTYRQGNVIPVERAPPCQAFPHCPPPPHPASDWMQLRPNDTSAVIITYSTEADRKKRGESVLSVHPRLQHPTTTTTPPEQPPPRDSSGLLIHSAFTLILKVPIPKEKTHCTLLVWKIQPIGHLTSNKLKKTTTLQCYH